MIKDSKTDPVAVGNTNGYVLIREALQLRGSDPEMEFAAAVVSSWPKREQHEKHLHNAVAGAANDPLLATNLTAHFGKRKENAKKRRTRRPSCPSSGVNTFFVLPTVPLQPGPIRGKLRGLSSSEKRKAANRSGPRTACGKAAVNRLVGTNASHIHSDALHSHNTHREARSMTAQQATSNFGLAAGGEDSEDIEFMTSVVKCGESRGGFMLCR